MDDDLMRIMELAQQGFVCSQILLIMGLENQGKECPELVRSMHALGSGVGGQGDICGALTGGACLLGLYAGRGEVNETPDPNLNPMINELFTWFSETYTHKYGGIKCVEILDNNPGNKSARCPELVVSTYQKAMEILEYNGYLEDED